MDDTDLWSVSNHPVADDLLFFGLQVSVTGFFLPYSPKSNSSSKLLTFSYLLN